ncbi:MAG: PAS domain S-box protein, partial [Syntrophales bacterium]|nr:PAS domain S-box protein [Syntrophales bacterium]
MNDQHLYNSRIISSFVEFLNAVRPEVDIQNLLSRSGILPYEVEDEGHWLTQKQVDDFHDALIKVTNDPSLFREAGRYMLHSRSVQSLRQFIVGFITPVQAYKMLGKITSYISRGSTFKATAINRNKVEIVTAPMEGVKLKPYQCENSMGAFEAVSGLFSRRLPVIDHPDCIHRGDDCCRYILSWEEPAYSRWRRRRNYMAVISIAATGISALVLSPGQIAATALVLAGLVAASAFYALYLEKRDLNEKVENQGDAASRLLDQITIGYNNSLMVQEIGQAVSSILDVNKLLRFIMETLEKRLKFDRAMIMMANHDRTRLTYMIGYGYSPEMENHLRETQFRLDNPRARGPFVVAFKQQNPFLVDNIKDMEGEVSQRSLEFIKLFRVNSFICVPIVYEGKSEGILAVDNYSTVRPHSQSEVSLLMGIAQQIAISINNARSLQQVMEREECFRALSENSPDIIYTIDSSGEITYINPAAEDILGYSREEITGKNLAEFADPVDVNSFDRLFHRVSRERDTIKNVEVTLRAKNGRERLFYMSGAPNLNARGEMTGIVGTLKDFSDQRQLERQLQPAARMNAIGRLTGGISHDFNNVLQAITAY